MRNINNFIVDLRHKEMKRRPEFRAMQGQHMPISQKLSQHEIMNLRIFMLCVKIGKCETFSIRSNSAMRNGP